MELYERERVAMDSAKAGDFPRAIELMEKAIVIEKEKGRDMELLAERLEAFRRSETNIATMLD